MKTESAWLIERVKSDGTVFAPAQYFGYGDQSLTTDHMEAIRFCRKIDADKAIKLLKTHLYCASFEKFAATEHEWDVSPRSTDN